MRGIMPGGRCSARSSRSPRAGVARAAAAPLRRRAAPATQSAALVWGLHDPDRAARRCAACRTVARARRVLGRGVGAARAARKPGYAIPLDAIAVNPRRYARTVPPAARGAFARLRRGTTVISRTEAGLRDARVGDGAAARGGAPDARGRGRRRRAAARRRGGGGGGRPARAAAAVDGDRRAARPGHAARARPRHPARRRRPDPAGRTAARVGPVGPARPGTLKVRFGEPAVGLPYGSDWIRVDPAFVRRHIVSRRVPILGSVSCHRAMVPHLRAAMRELARRGLTRPRRPWRLRGLLRAAEDPAARPAVAARVGPGGRPQRLRATRSAAARARTARLVRVMEKHGFTWGGRWPTRPDPMHFEYRGWV